MAPGLLITTPDQCTSSWARTVTGLSHPRAKVSGVEVASVESGTTTRVRLRVSHDEPEIPRRWFVKLPSRRLRARLITALPRLVDTEIRFYQQLANDVGVGVPRALAAQRSLLKATLVLEDLGDTDCMLVEPAASFSITQARGAVRLLAHLHRRFLDCPRFETDLAWLGASIRRTEDWLGDRLALPLTRRGLRRARAIVPPRLGEDALRYARSRRSVMRVLNRNARTLVHHDCYPGNWYWRGDEPGLLDWQLVRIGDGIGDLAYLLGTALSTADRRRHEEELLTLYRTSSGLELCPSELAQRYTQHLVYPFEAMLLTLAIGGLMPTPANHTLLERATQAVLDHDSFGVLLGASA